MRRLDTAEALQLLAGVSLGRVVFTRDALPAIRPVNHLVEDGEIIIRTHEGAALTNAAGQGSPDGIVVAYEADQIDPATHTGWSVVVTGYARLVTDPDDAERYARQLHPWVDQAMDCTIRIHPEEVTGFRLTTRPPATP
nr:pyridoxamine 5'-phosphate oxidase family protein [Streptacidiphilus rugosus]